MCGCAVGGLMTFSKTRSRKKRLKLCTTITSNTGGLAAAS
jgi:hypothetical protein